jgi:DNA-binding response OmpR family regulator
MKRIFLVDDDERVRSRIRCALTQQEFEVHDFPSSTEALAAILVDTPDLLITGVLMPEMTGIDLAATVRRDAAPGLPIILVASRPSRDVITKARTLGIRHVLETPTDEVTELSAAVRRELFWIEATDTVRRLDNLRLEFLVDLSHQLRTPMTAMKLALDGLFSELYDLMNSSQHSLAKITCRNVERVVTLVENQLNLLQLMTGERPLCRRLVDLDQLLRALPRRLFPDGGVTPGDASVVVSRRAGDDSDIARPLYVFTDPELVSTLVDCALGVGPPSSRREIRLDYDPARESCRLDVHVDYGYTTVSTDGAVSTRFDEWEPTSALDFEYRALQTLLGELGGEVVMEKDESHKWICIQLPRYPHYDREKDFLEPVRNLRPPGDEGGSPPHIHSVHSVHFVKCDLGERASRDYLATEDPDVRGFFDRVTSVLSEGDAVIRSKQHGTIYLALFGRSDHELDHVVGFLAGKNGDDTPADGDGKPYVWKPQTIASDQQEIDRLVRELELV